jgi:2-amino-4-hydroxy-6-hydroxymethyldihydropteridine diphosphokinase
MIYKYYLGLGSNIEPRLHFLKTAVEKLKEHGQISQKSSIFLTEPWAIENQLDYYNAVIEYLTPLTPRQLLSVIKKLEKEVGRTDRYHWGPREIDIDILLSDTFYIDEPGLHIPHKMFHQRRFVLEPMSEMHGNFVAAGSHKTIIDYLRGCQDSSEVKKLNLSW